MRFAPAVLLVLACAPSAPPSHVAPAGVSAREAGSVIGQTVVVSGDVVQVKTRAHGGYAYLNFGGRFPDHAFAVLIPDSVVARFGDLMRFEGHRARATGRVWLQDEKWPAMTLTDPATLELLP